MSKKNIILIIILVILFIGVSIAIYLFTRDEDLMVTGSVIVSGNNYVILEATDADYFVRDIENSYEVGDEVTITYKKSSLDDTTTPVEIVASVEKLVKKNEDEINTEEEESTDASADHSSNEIVIEEQAQNSENTQINETNTNNNITSSNSVNHTTNNSSNTNQNINQSITNNENISNGVTAKTADEAVLEYVNEIEEDADRGITDSLKDGFITVVDFLFYDGEISGHTFDELSTSAKLEVLKAALWIDEKVDSAFPGYKETISSGASKAYNSVKNLVVSTYLDITSSICENHSDLCESAKQDFQSLKESFGLTWDFLKSLASSGLDKLKNWYEVWSGK